MTDVEIEKVSEWWERTRAEVYFPTLASSRSNNEGTLALTALKKMSGTERFLSKDDSVKKCSQQSYEECQTEAFLEEVQEKCGCVPWSLSPALPQPPATFCSPASIPCYTEIAEKDHGCRPSCTGLYADVSISERKTQINFNTDIMNYWKYKSSCMRNIQFDAQNINSGELFFIL